jgi:hypothetical protein
VSYKFYNFHGIWYIYVIGHRIKLYKNINLPLKKLHQDIQYIKFVKILNKIYRTYDILNIGVLVERNDLSMNTFLT